MLVYEPLSNRVSRINIENNNIRSRITNFTLDKFNSCWISSRSGLSRVLFANNVTETYTFNKTHGVISTKINGLTFLYSTLYLATDKGVICIDTIDLYKCKAPPYLIIKKVKINDEYVKIKGEYILPYYKNNLEISFKGVDFKRGKKPSLFIQLNGFK